MSETTTLQAGRDLDALVAEKVMGWTWWKWEVASSGEWVKSLFGPDEMDIPRRHQYLPCEASAPLFHASHSEKPPRYSMDIAAAWQVVEAMLAAGVHISVAPTTTGTKWAVAAIRKQPYRYGYEVQSTAPLAICRAALAAVEASA